MPLSSGTVVGSYEIVSMIGAGGMGEVYRARDTRLHREIALKVLPELFARDPDRLARLTREAQVLASLNHPNIAAIYGIEGNALVMELVEGEDLSIQVGRGPLPIPEALAIARQIAEALEAAHERGIVHRDLKPANIKVSPDGSVKVLDFGLAKALSADAGRGGSDVANSPTFTSPAMTEMGVILGTAAYMAPEQARGKIVDRRADIWAFGCVLFEMLSAAPPFEGDTVTDVLSAIVSREPDWAKLPATTPSAVRTLLRRCLEKDPRRRLRDIGEARVLLEQPIDDALPDLPAAGAARRRSPVWIVPALAVLALLLAVSIVVVLLANKRSATSGVPRAITRYDVQLPDKAAVNIVFRPAVSVSADGSGFAFVGTAEGVNRIYVRSRGDAVTRVIAGSEGGGSPALSPDGRWVAFFADGNVRKARLDGTAMTLGPARDVRGITWVDASTLILTADSGAPLSRMSAMGGEVSPVTALAAGERTHRWPSALADGKAVLFTVGTIGKPDTYDDGTIDVVTLATGERRVLVKGAAMARACGRDHLVYSKGTSLYGVPFDTERLQLTGAAVEIVEGVERDASTGAAHFDCSGEGTLVYVPGTASGDLSRLTWMDREGGSQPIGLSPDRYQEVRVSPDGTRVALLKGTSGAGDVWIYDIGAGKMTRLTFNGTSAAPSWSADGRTVYYTVFDASGERSSIARKVADGSRDAETLRAVVGRRSYIGAVDEAREAVILDAVVTVNDRGDVLRVPLAPSAEAQPLVSTRFNEFGSSVSPGGQWLAYQSDETSRPEIYIMDLANPALHWQVTSAGGEEPHWSRDGRELYYRTANRLMAVPIAAGPSFRAGNPHALFDGIHNSGIESGRSYDVDPKTGRFLLVVRARDDRATSTVRVVLNWDAELSDRPR